MFRQLIIVCLAAMLCVTSAQFHHYYSGPRPGPAPLPAPPSGGSQDTGPILFPRSPDAGDTSGVIVGGSGYGFVPPRSSQFGASHFGSGPHFGAFF